MEEEINILHDIFLSLLPEEERQQQNRTASISLGPSHIADLLLAPSSNALSL